MNMRLRTRPFPDNWNYSEKTDYTKREFDRKTLYGEDRWDPIRLQ